MNYVSMDFVPLDGNVKASPVDILQLDDPWGLAWGDHHSEQACREKRDTCNLIW